jgi:hypothetical protein
MPLFVHQLDLFDEKGHRERIADGDDLPDDFQTLPPQSAASSAIVIDTLLRELEAVASVLNDAISIHIYQHAHEAEGSYHAEVVEDAFALSDVLRTYWPGLRYRYDR